MKRDWDLIRKILFATEQNPYPDLPVTLNIEGYDPELITYHVRLLDEAGLIEAYDAGEDTWQPTRLTWNGHEFLDASKNDEFWNKAKETLKKVGSATFPYLFQILLDLAKEAAVTP